MKKYTSLEHFNMERGALNEMYVIELDILSSFTSKGDSAYEVAVSNGFDGTEKEWLEYLRQPAVDAANRVDELLQGIPPNFTDALNSKVDKETGKSLIETTKIQKLDGIEDGAQVNTVTSVAGKIGDVTLFKGDVGLGNVDNTSDADKPVSKAQKSAIDSIEGTINTVKSELNSHKTDTSNPHKTTKAQVGLGSVDNTSDANKPVSNATKEQLNLKYDKTGGLISGDVQVEGIIESTGDIVAKKKGAVVFASGTQGGAGYLWELLDTEITEPKRGDVLVFDGVNWVNAGKINLDGGTYNGF